MIRKILGVLFLVFVIAVSASAGTPYMVTFQTTDCNGDTGIASVGINRIYKIETVECDSPYQAAKRKQVLVTSQTLHGSYDVFTVDEKEAINIQKQIQAYMDARRKLLENGSPIILHDN
ncbi:MAG: hypothetical protein GWP07_05155 [Xanthomonadaceae bacterium]|nr:hypothetical protein [Xanthomonadaceae bacterium]